MSGKTELEPVWLDAEGGYQLALFGGGLVCRNPKGKQLKSVPSKVKKGAAAESLLALRDWLAGHERECADRASTWMLRSLPVPRPVLVAVWDDPAWRGALQDAVVGRRTADGVFDGDDAGFLRAVDAERGVGLVNIDGETVWSEAEQFLLPHPILLEERDEYRELATDLGIEQGIPQLFRETFDKPEAVAEGEARVATYADGRFEQLNYALGRCRTLGYRVRGGFACCTVWEAQRVAQARYWIGAEYPEAETYTGELIWVDRRERSIAISDVGRVAYSEGMLMASSVFAGRAKEEAGGDA